MSNWCLLLKQESLLSSHNTSLLHLLHILHYFNSRGNAYLLHAHFFLHISVSVSPQARDPPLILSGSPTHLLLAVGEPDYPSSHNTSLLHLLHIRRFFSLPKTSTRDAMHIFFMHFFCAFQTFSVYFHLFVSPLRLSLFIPTHKTSLQV